MGFSSYTGTVVTRDWGSRMRREIGKTDYWILSHYVRGTRHCGPLLLPRVIVNRNCLIQISKSYKILDVFSIKKQSVFEETDIYKMISTRIEP